MITPSPAKKENDLIMYKLEKLPILKEMKLVKPLTVMETPLVEKVLDMSSSGSSVSFKALSNPLMSTYTLSYPMPISKNAISLCKSPRE